VSGDWGERGGEAMMEEGKGKRGKWA